MVSLGIQFQYKCQREEFVTSGFLILYISASLQKPSTANYKKRKISEALFIKEQKLNEQGQSIPLRLFN